MNNNDARDDAKVLAMTALLRVLMDERRERDPNGMGALGERVDNILFDDNRPEPEEIRMAAVAYYRQEIAVKPKR